jgi:hypothetical protein
MTSEPYDYLLTLPCKILFWDVGAQKWCGSKNGWIFLIPYADNEKTQIVFKPRTEEARTMWYCADLADMRDGLRCKIHEAFAVERHQNDPRCIIFGKAASRSYVNAAGKAIKTAWMARFKEFWEANAFFFMLKRLSECGGKFSSFEDERKHAVVDSFLTNVEEEYEETDEDNSANNEEVKEVLEILSSQEEESDNDEEVKEVLEILSSQEEESDDDEEVKEVLEILSSQEEESDDDEELDKLVNLPDHLCDIDIDTAIRLRRRMTHPEGPSMYDDYEDDEEEVAESQPLFH